MADPVGPSTIDPSQNPSQSETQVAFPKRVAFDLRVLEATESIIGESPDNSLAQLQDWGRYTEISYLGHGGMGEVFKAYDPSLGRFVALKLIRSADPAWVKRFLFEARAQARVEHAHVCRVYEVGRFKGMPYLAMQFIEGQGLDQLAHSLGLQEKVEVLLHVAEAIHEAHLRGLIHRDIKPSNVMLERDSLGAWKPYVMDFGISREPGGAGMTDTGRPIGTPAFMPPEQARGENARLDFRTDVYGLGATLYTVLTGHLPFDGTALEVMSKVLVEDPPRPRKYRPEIPRDLETIVLKAMEKLPERRYASAQAFAEDIRRYLAHEPVAAAPPSLAYRVRKRVERNRALSAVVAASMALLLLLGALALRTALRGRERARLAQRFGQEAERLDARLRLVRLLPLHDVQAEVDATHARMLWIESEIHRLGSVAEGPGYLALGRTWLNLGEVPRAVRFLRLAWDSGEHSAETAQTLGLALGQLYLEEQRRAVRNGVHGQPNPLQRRELEQRRDEALRYLRAGSGAFGPAAPLAQAMEAFCQDRPDAALSLCRSAFQATPWMYESEILAVQHYLLMTEKANAENRTGEAAEYLRRAEEAVSAVQRVAASEAQAYCLRAETAKTRAIHADWQGRDALPLLNEMEAQARQALLAESRNTEAALELGQALLRKVMWQAERRGRSGGDLVRQLEEARARFGFILAQDPSHWRARLCLSECLLSSAMEAYNRGQDPLPFCHEAVNEARRALQTEPGQVFDVQDRLGRTLFQQAVWEQELGGETRGTALACIEAFQKARESQPDNITVASNQALGRFVLADCQADCLGEDPLPQLQMAVADWRRGLERDPKDPALLLNMGEGLTHVALERYGGGGPLAPEFPEGLRALEKGGVLLHSEPESPLFQGLALLKLSEYRAQEGEDPRPTLVQARVLFRKVARLSNSKEGASPYEAASHLLEGEWRLRIGEEASGCLSEARACLARLGQGGAASPYQRLQAARAVFLDWRIRHGDSRQVQEAVASLRRIHPGYLPGLLLEMEACRALRDPLWARRALDALKNAGPHFRSRPWTQALEACLHLVAVSSTTSGTLESRRLMAQALAVRPGLARSFAPELARLGMPRPSGGSPRKGRNFCSVNVVLSQK